MQLLGLLIAARNSVSGDAGVSWGHHDVEDVAQSMGDGVFAGLPSPLDAGRYHSLAIARATLPAELLEILVAAYWGEASVARVARARLWALMSKYGWTLWASIQEGISVIDFDYWSWGMEKYDRAVEEFDSPDFERWLAAAAS